MSEKLKGSDLTRKMLESDNTKVWCAVSNESDDDAIATVRERGYHLLTYISSYDSDGFISREGYLWQYAVPVRKVALTSEDVGLGC